MKRYKELVILSGITLIAVVIAGFIYLQNTNIQTTPYQPTPTLEQTSSSASSGGTAASATSPSIQPSIMINNSGTSAQIKVTINPTTGVNTTQPSTFQQTGPITQISASPTP